MARDITASQNQLAKLRNVELSLQQEIDAHSIDKNASAKEMLSIKLAKLANVRGDIADVQYEINALGGEEKTKKEVNKKEDANEDKKIKESRIETSNSSEPTKGRGLKYLDHVDSTKEKKEIGAYKQNAEIGSGSGVSNQAEDDSEGGKKIGSLKKNKNK